MADGYATLAYFQRWADEITINRDPDVVIGSDYLRRWWITPRSVYNNTYLHWFGRSDDDRALHDHPWDNASYILQGEYLEHTPEGVFLRRAGDYIARKATSLHRIELIDGNPVLSLFTTGPKVREWGFACPQGWVHWEVFCAPGDSTQIGKGCGE